MKKWIISISLGLLGVALFSQAESPKPILFITDASGSMWQKVGNAYKIEIARQVLADLVLGMPENQPIGLVVYGHREKSNCADIEQLLPISNLDKNAFINALKDLSPLGKTPLAQAAEFVLAQLTKSNQPATIILITDGLETCAGDICSIVNEAKILGIEFVMHIIGFDLGDDDRSPLECAARASDGLYIDASDQAQLAKALQQTKDLTIDIPKGRLAVECKRNGQLIDGLISARKTGTESVIASLRSYTGSKTNPAIFNIPAGTYDIEVELIGQRGIPAQRKTQIKVMETDTNFQYFDFSSGFVELKVTENGKLHDATINIRKKGEKISLTGGRTYTSPSHNPMKKELSPGLYEIDIKSVSIKGYASSVTKKDVQIIGEQTNQTSHDFRSAKLVIGTTFQGKFCDGSINIASISPREAVHGGRTYAKGDSNMKTFILSPGKYEIDVRGIRLGGDPREKFTIELKPGETIEKMVNW